MRLPHVLKVQYQGFEMFPGCSWDSSRAPQILMQCILIIRFPSRISYIYICIHIYIEFLSFLAHMEDKCVKTVKMTKIGGFLHLTKFSVTSQLGLTNFWSTESLKTLIAGQGAVRHLPWFQNVSPRCRAPSLPQWWDLPTLLPYYEYGKLVWIIRGL